MSQTSSPMNTGANLDPSAFANWRPAPVNVDVLGALQQGQALQNARLQNQNLLAQRAAGSDYQASINPLTGQPSLQGFGQRIATDPQAAFAAQDAVKSAVANAHAAFDLHLKQTQAAAALAGDAYTQAVKDPTNAAKYARDAIVQGHADGLLSADQAATAIAQIPDNPKDVITHLQIGAGALSSTAQNMQNFIGTPSTVQTGGSTLTGVTSPTTGAFRPATGIPNQLSPGQAIAPVTYQTPAGTTTMPGQTAAAELNGAGAPNVGPGYAQPPGGSAPPAPATAAQAPAAPDTGSGPYAGFSFPEWTKANPVGVNTIPAGLPEAQKTSTDLYNTDVNQTANIANKVNLLQSIISESSNANPGTMASQMEQFGSALHQLGLVSGQQATNLDLINKDAGNLIAQAGSSLGVPTDGKLLTITESNPNAKMTPEAIQGAAAQLRGLYEYKNAEMSAFNAYQQQGQAQGYQIGPSSYATFNKQFQEKVPVAVFQLRQLPPSIRDSYIKSLSKDDKAKLAQGIQFAQKAGLLQ